MQSKVKLQAQSLLIEFNRSKQISPEGLILAANIILIFLNLSGMQPEKPRLFAKDVEINTEVVVKKLNELVAARGKKSTDRQDQIELLVELRAIAKAHNLTCALDAKILFNIIAAIFDYNPNIATSMKSEMFEK